MPAPIDPRVRSVARLIREGEISGALVDLDGTLYSSKSNVEFQIRPAMCATVAEYLQIDERRARRLLVDYWNEYGSGVLGLQKNHGIDGKQFLVDVFLKVDISSILVDRALVDGISLLAERIKLCLVTNSSTSHARRVLSHLGIESAFAIVRGCEDAGFLYKPNPDVYRSALRETGMIPAQTLGIDDSFPNLRTLKLLGLRTVLVSNEIAEPPLFWEMHHRIYHTVPEYVDCYSFERGPLFSALAQG